MISSVKPAIGVLLSGGLDSSILLAKLLDEGHRVQPFYIRTDLFWQEAELAAVRRFLAAIAKPALNELAILDLPMSDLYRDHWSVSGHNAPGHDSPDAAVFLPGRNALLLVKAAIWCQMRGIEYLALRAFGNQPVRRRSGELFQRLPGGLELRRFDSGDHSSSLPRHDEERRDGPRPALSARTHVLLHRPPRRAALRSLQQVRGASGRVCNDWRIRPHGIRGGKEW